MVTRGSTYSPGSKTPKLVTEQHEHNIPNSHSKKAHGWRRALCELFTDGDKFWWADQWCAVAPNMCHFDQAVKRSYHLKAHKTISSTAVPLVKPEIASGDLVTDVVTLGGTSIDNQTFLLFPEYSPGLN